MINGGDGSHEHPTQTLCDLFTLKKKNKRLKNLKVAISGDLRGSRTIHSFVYALARFGATIMPMAGQGHGTAGPCRPAAARGIRLPDGVGAQGRRRRRRDRRALRDARGAAPAVAVLRARTSTSTRGVVDKKVDAVYVTRFQKERWAEKDQAYPKIDRKFLNEPKYSDASVMHPLPRVGELDAVFDSDRRAVYFEQAAYGVPVRMALISLLLGIKGKSLHKFEGGFERRQFPVYDQPRSRRHALRQHELHRARADGEPIRAQQVLRRAGRGAPDACKLRCVYCESDIEQFVVASRKNKWFASEPAPLLRTNDHALKDLLVFANEADALAAGFHSRRAAPEARPPQRRKAARG